MAERKKKRSNGGQEEKGEGNCESAHPNFKRVQLDKHFSQSKDNDHNNEHNNDHNNDIEEKIDFEEKVLKDKLESGREKEEEEEREETRRGREGREGREGRGSGGGGRVE